MNKENITEKKCTKCGEVKPLGEFHKNIGRKFNLHDWCKSCKSKSFAKSKNKKLNKLHMCFKCGKLKKLKEFNYTIDNRICKQCKKLEKINRKEKKCTKCKNVKSINEFNKYSRNLDGRHAYCKECSREYSNERNKDPIVKLKSGKYRARPEVKKAKKEYYEKNKIVRDVFCIECDIKINNKNANALYCNKCYKERKKIKDKERFKKLYEENKDKIKEIQKKYYEKNKDKLIEKSKEYRKKNKEKIKKKARELNKTQRVRINGKAYYLNTCPEELKPIIEGLIELRKKNKYIKEIQNNG